jgi:hypothetical protein
MVTIDGVAQAVPSRDIGPNRGALTTADYLRVASMAIAAYEYVVRKVLMTAIVTYPRPVISSLSPPNFGYTRLQVHVGKTADVQVTRITV